MRAFTFLRHEQSEWTLQNRFTGEQALLVVAQETPLCLLVKHLADEERLARAAEAAANQETSRR